MDTPADRLKKARRRKGIKTAVEAATRLAINKQTYQNYEDGARGFSRHLIKIARFYGVRPQWLATGDLPMTATELENVWYALSPVSQAKALEYMEMLAAKDKGN